MGDGPFKAIVSTDCEILASEFLLFSRPMKQEKDKIFLIPRLPSDQSHRLRQK